MTVADQMARFADRHGKQLIVQAVPWRYYRLGAGPAVLWLTVCAGLRSPRRFWKFLPTITPSSHPTTRPCLPSGISWLPSTAFWPPSPSKALRWWASPMAGCWHRRTWRIDPRLLSALVLSSSGPADYARVWLPSLRLFVLLARVLPGWVLKESVRIGLGGLTRQLPQRERIEMADLIRVIVSQELSRADVVSHFAVATDVIRAQIVTPAALQKLEW